MSKALTSAEVKTALETLPEWKLSDNALTADFTFRDFRQAITFMVRVGFEAEALNHHPEWTNSYNRVAIRLSTHDAGGKVTAKDVDLARRIEKIRG